MLVANKRQARKVRWVCWGSLIWAIGWLIWAADISQTYGLSSGDGGVLRAAGERGALAAILGAVGVLPCAGLAFYARRYVIRLVRSGGCAEVTVIGFWTPLERKYPVAAFRGSTEHEGRTWGHVSVNAPWLTLRIAGKRYVVDLQSERVDRRGLAHLASGGTQARTPKQA